MKKNKRPIILVSSTVYGIEELLERIYTLLTTFGYEVWMSHKGTVPVASTKSAFENCIHAVENCDLFLGIITPRYGSGIDKDEENGISITHRELLKAIELNKPRWMLVHERVVFARSLLGYLGYKNGVKRRKMKLEKNEVFDDMRIIDMYENAIRKDTLLQERLGNWVQKYDGDASALLFATAQFSRFQEVEAFVMENLSDPAKTPNKRSGGGSGYHG